MKKYMADFETTTRLDDCRVWLWCAVNLDNLDERHYGLDIESFFDLISEGANTVYFHNLKFDGQFILSYAARKLHFVYDAERKPKTFNTLINDTGVFYKIELIFSRKGKHTAHTVFLDSLKKLNFPVKTIAQAYGLEETKGEIDHTLYRKPGYEPTQNEYDYVTNDVIIVAKALNILFEQGLTKMTQSSDGLAFCQQLLTRQKWDFISPFCPLKWTTRSDKAIRAGRLWCTPIGRA